MTFAPVPMLMLMAWRLGESSPGKGGVTRRAASPFCSRDVSVPGVQPGFSAMRGSGVGAHPDSLSPAETGFPFQLDKLS